MSKGRRTKKRTAARGVEFSSSSAVPTPDNPQDSGVQSSEDSGHNLEAKMSDGEGQVSTMTGGVEQDSAVAAPLEKRYATPPPPRLYAAAAPRALSNREYHLQLAGRLYEMEMKRILSGRQEKLSAISEQYYSHLLESASPTPSSTYPTAVDTAAMDTPRSTRRETQKPARLRNVGESGAAAGLCTAQQRLPGISGGYHPPGHRPGSNPRAAASTARITPQGGSVHPPQLATAAPAAPGTLQSGVLSSQGDGSQLSERRQSSSPTNSSSLSSTFGSYDDESVSEMFTEGAAGAAGVGGAGAAVVKVVHQGKGDATLYSSIIRAQKKGGYKFWTARLAKKACVLRNISGQSRENNIEVLANLLTKLDNVLERESPYYADLLDKAAGGTPCAAPLAPKNEADQPPQALVDMYRAAVEAGANNPPDKLHAWEGKSYTTAALLAAILEKDTEAGAATPSARKSAHCVPRFCEIIADERFRHKYGASKLQLSRQELNSKQTGKKRNIMIEIWEAWKDADVKVAASLADDMHIVGARINPNLVLQPDCEFTKFLNMIRDVTKDYNERDDNYTKSGSHDQWWSICGNSIDTYYFGEILHLYPDLKKVCYNLMLEEAQREDSGVGGMGAAAAGGEKGAERDAARRDAAKRKASASNADFIPKKKSKKTTDEASEIANKALDAAVGKLGLENLGDLLKSSGPAEPAGPPPDAPSWRDSKEGSEDRAARFDLFDRMVKAINTNEENIKIAQEKNNERMVKLLTARGASLEEALEKELQRPI